MTYADNYNLRLATATANDVASAVDGLLTTYGSQEISGSVINTSSASFVVLTGSSITVSVASGEIVEIIATITLSHGTASTGISFTVEQDGVDQSPVSRWTSPTTTSTGGLYATITWTKILAPSVGSHTYKIKWATDAGTAYSARAYLSVKVLQNT